VISQWLTLGRVFLPLATAVAHGKVKLPLNSREFSESEICRWQEIYDYRAMSDAAITNPLRHSLECDTITPPLGCACCHRLVGKCRRADVTLMPISPSAMISGVGWARPKSRGRWWRCCVLLSPKHHPADVSRPHQRLFRLLSGAGVVEPLVALLHALLSLCRQPSSCRCVSPLATFLAEMMRIVIG